MCTDMYSHFGTNVCSVLNRDVRVCAKGLLLVYTGTLTLAKSQNSSQFPNL